MTRPSEPTDSAERLVFFTDAVVAIALTLLVLPLVELVPEARREGLELSSLLRDNLPQLGAFLLSFVVIFRFWWSHHGLFRHVSRLNLPVVLGSAVWTCSIVFLPVPTAVITAYAPSVTTVTLYLGTLVLTTGSMTVLAVVVHRDPGLSVGRSRETREEVLNQATTFGTQLLALVVGTVFVEAVNYYALLLMLLSGPIEALVKRRWVDEPEPLDVEAAEPADVT